MEAMTVAHCEMHDLYDRINSLWDGVSRPITDDDQSSGWLAEVLRWCRDKLGGRDQDLVGEERWEPASREVWSKSATYSCLPGWHPAEPWWRYVHNVSHYVDKLLRAQLGSCKNETHSVTHA